MKWTKDKIKILTDLYPNNTNKDIAEILGTTKPSIARRAKKLNLYKSKEHKSKLIKARTRDLSYENLVEIAKKYKSKLDFQKNDSSAYSASGVMCVKDKICSHMISQSISRPQLMLKYIIKKLFDRNILYNTRKIIKPYELDIYIPDLKLAFEYDGKHWHNNRIEIDDKKDKLCISNNIKLIRINDDNCYLRYYLSNIKEQLLYQLTEINNYCKTSITSEQINCITDNEILVFINEKILDYDKIREITKKYNNYKEFKISEKSLYCKLIQLGCITEFTSHMKKDIIYWNSELCKKEINKYTSFADFYKKSYKCYIYIQRNNLYQLLNNFKNYPKRLEKRIKGNQY